VHRQRVSFTSSFSSFKSITRVNRRKSCDVHQHCSALRSLQDNHIEPPTLNNQLPGAVKTATTGCTENCNSRRLHRWCYGFLYNIIYICTDDLYSFTISTSPAGFVLHHSPAAPKVSWGSGPTCQPERRRSYSEMFGAPAARSSRRETANSATMRTRRTDGRTVIITILLYRKQKISSAPSRIGGNVKTIIFDFD